MPLLDDIRVHVIDGQAKPVGALVAQALHDGISPSAILSDALIPAMSEVGELFEQGEYYVPEMLIAARAMKAGLELLKPLLAASGAEPVGRVAIGTVKGDLHDIGKSLVGMMLEGAGFEVLDLGIDVAPEQYVEAVRGGIDIVAMSALLTTTMPHMKATVEALQVAGMRDRTKILVGGAPVTQSFAEEIGADGYAADASSAVRKAKELLKN